MVSICIYIHTSSMTDATIELTEVTLFEILAFNALCTLSINYIHHTHTHTHISSRTHEMRRDERYELIDGYTLVSASLDLSKSMAISARLTEEFSKSFKSSCTLVLWIGWMDWFMYGCCSQHIIISHS